MSKLYKSFFTRIVALYSSGINIIYNVNGTLNTNLSSHGGKKAFMQSMSDIGNNPVATVFRAGLSVKKMHTMFDYVFGSSLMDVETGLNISGWVNPSGPGPKNGGLSPVIDDALNAGTDSQKSTEKTLIKSFTSRLFFSSTLDDELHYLLVAALFKHWDSMVSTCVEKLQLKNIHTVIAIVNGALTSLNISKDVFQSWCKNTALQFRLKNIMALDYNEIQDLPAGSTVDVRNFQDQQETMLNMLNYSNRNFTAIKQSVVQLREQQVKMDSKLDLILSYITHNVPAATILNNSPLCNNTSSTPDQNSITQNDGLKINSVPSTLSFQKWLVTKVMGVSKKYVQSKLTFIINNLI